MAKKNKQFAKTRDRNLEKIYYLPFDTAHNLKNIKVIDNFSLYLNKIKIYNFNNKKNKLPKLFTPTNHKEVTKSYYEKLKKLNLIKETFEVTTDEKLIIGLGNTSVYEVSLTLHHIYGVPYIPGSAIKGSFRSYLIEKYFDNNEEKAMKENWFKTIFGSEENQGKVIFFDAFDVSDLDIFPDIINPHYQDYYSNDKVYPTDDKNPVPIPFLVVKGKFKFVFGVRENFEVDINGNKKNVLEFVKEELENSLKEFGIGAKTTVGYGYFI